MRVLLLVFVAMLGLSSGVWGWSPSIHGEITKSIIFNDLEINKLFFNNSHFDFYTVPGDNFYSSEVPHQHFCSLPDDKSDTGGDPNYDQYKGIEKWSSFYTYYGPNSPFTIEYYQSKSPNEILYMLTWIYSTQSKREKIFRILAHNSQDVCVPICHAPANEVWCESANEITIETGLVDPKYDKNADFISIYEMIDNYKDYPSFETFYNKYLLKHKGKTIDLAKRAQNSEKNEPYWWNEEQYRYEGVDNALMLSSFLMHTYLYLEKYGWDNPFSYIDINAEEVFKWNGSGEYTTNYTYVPDTEECPSGTIKTYLRHQYNPALIACKNTIYTPKSLKVRSFGVAEINKKVGQTIILNNKDKLTVIANNKIIIHSGFQAKRGSNAVFKSNNIN